MGSIIVFRDIESIMKWVSISSYFEYTLSCKDIGFWNKACLCPSKMLLVTVNVLAWFICWHFVSTSAFCFEHIHVYFFLPHLLLLNKSKTNGWIEKWYFHRFWFYKEIYIQSVMGSCGTQTWSIHLCFQYTFPYILYKIINVQAKPICSFIFCLAHHPFWKCDMNVSAVKVRSIYSK